MQKKGISLIRIMVLTTVPQRRRLRTSQGTFRTQWTKVFLLFSQTLVCIMELSALTNRTNTFRIQGLFDSNLQLH